MLPIYQLAAKDKHSHLHDPAKTCNQPLTITKNSKGILFSKDGSSKSTKEEKINSILCSDM